MASAVSFDIGHLHGAARAVANLLIPMLVTQNGHVWGWVSWAIKEIPFEGDACNGLPFKVVLWMEETRSMLKCSHSNFLR